MYYEEQWIEGALCWRTSPNGAWTRYTANELAHRYESAEKRAADAQATVEALQRENACKDTLIETLQAQLRQVEGERDQWIAANTKEPINEPVTYQALAGARFVAKRAFDELVKARSDLSALRQLVEVHTKQLTELTIIPIGCSREQELRWTQSIKDLRATLDATTPARGQVKHEK